MVRQRGCSWRSAPARNRALDRVEQRARRPRGRGRAGRARRCAETPPSGSRKRTGPSIAVELARRSSSPIARILVGRGAHQRDLRVVAVEGAALDSARARCRGAPKLTMSSAPHRADIGQPRADDRAEAVLGRGGSTPPTITSADLGGGDVDHAGEQAAVASFSIDCPPMPVAWKTRQS